MRDSQTHSPSAEASDRGGAKYFHGREKILSNFKDVLWLSEHKKAGATFLIQGAPGAGKTALLSKCEELTQDRKWATAKIDSAALWDPNELLQALKSGRTLDVRGGAARVGVSGFLEAEIKAERSPQTVKNLLRGGDSLPFMQVKNGKI